MDHSGWIRDRHYFQSVTDRFHLEDFRCGCNLKAAHSTRRENLEEREIAPKALKHTAFLEEPAPEDTRYYHRERFDFRPGQFNPNRLTGKKCRNYFESHESIVGET